MVGGISSDTGRASSTPRKAHSGMTFSAEQLSVAQPWWFCNFRLCLAPFLLDCVNIMAIQLKCSLNKWCLLLANVLALLSSLISHQNHTTWLWLLKTLTAVQPLWAWFFYPKIQAQLYGCGHILLGIHSSYGRSLSRGILEVFVQMQLSLPLYILLCYTGEVFLCKDENCVEECEWRAGQRVHSKTWLLHPSSASVFSFKRWRQ